MRTSSRLLVLVAVALALAATVGCGGSQNIFAPGGPAARQIADLGWFVIITFSAVTVIMWVLIAWVALRRRGSFAEHAPWDASGGLAWVLIGGFTIPAIILAVVFVWGLQTMSAFPLGGEPEGQPPMIRIVGHQWWWEVHYPIGEVNEWVVTANEIHLPAGRPVTIALQSTDVIHSFWVPELHGKVDLIPGMTNRIRVQSDEPRIYRGECAEYCGPQHAHMILSVVADRPEDFERWLARMREPAAAPTDPQALRGQQVFMKSACVLCHSIRGTDAHARIGPDLTHLASRSGIAANALPNSTAALAGWVTHAQSLKPYARMPNITAFNGAELRELVAYLQTLR
jgi:cytochrome c oxidase subunit 2